MSQENLELVRRQSEAFDRDDLAQASELTEPDFACWDRANDPRAAGAAD
jgi:ketosteroid isomerase-like protein